MNLGTWDFGPSMNQYSWAIMFTRRLRKKSSIIFLMSCKNVTLVSSSSFKLFNNFIEWFWSIISKKKKGRRRKGLTQNFQKHCSIQFYRSVSQLIPVASMSRWVLVNRWDGWVVHNLTIERGPFILCNWVPRNSIGSNVKKFKINHQIISP